MGRPRSAEADAAILEAAFDLLVERGVAATSIEQVAKRAGVSRATVYRRFPDKVALLVATVEAAYGNPPENPEITDVESMLSGWSKAMSLPKQRRLLRRLYAAADDHPELARTYWAATQQGRDRARRDAIARAREQGMFPADVDVDVVLQVLNGALWHHLATYPDTTGPRAIKRYLVTILRALGYRPDGTAG